MKNFINQLSIALIPLMWAQLSLASPNLGIHSSELAIECSGQLITDSVSDVHLTPGFTDRAGKYHPPKGAATLHLKTDNLSSGCAVLKSKLGIDLEHTEFTQYYSTTSTVIEVIEKQAQLEIGKSQDFVSKQTFGYMDQDGYLPFFPLIHQESFTVNGKYLKVDTAKAYNIYLYEEDKIQLTELIFKYINEQGLKNKLSQQLLSPLLNHSPQFEKNFDIYLKKVLLIFKQLEEAHEVNNIDINLISMASGINSLTNSYPQYYYFNIPELVTNHPSLFYVFNQDYKKAFPNLSAQQLEKAVDLIAEQLAHQQMNVNIKASYQDLLKEMAGHFAPGGKLASLSSTYTKEKAEQILKTYY